MSSKTRAEYEAIVSVLERLFNEAEYSRLLAKTRGLAQEDDPVLHDIAASFMLNATIESGDLAALQDEAIPLAELCHARVKEEPGDNAAAIGMNAYNLGNGYGKLAELLECKLSELPAAPESDGEATRRRWQLEHSRDDAASKTRARFAEALRYRSGMSQNNQVRLLTNTGGRYLDEGRLFEAFDVCEEALRLDPTHPIALLKSVAAIGRIASLRGVFDDENGVALIHARDRLNLALGQPERSLNEASLGIGARLAHHSTRIDQLLRAQGGESRLRAEKQRRVDNHRDCQSSLSPSMLEQHSLELRFELFCCVCPSRRGDTAYFTEMNQTRREGASLTEMDDEFDRMVDMLNEAKESFIAARGVYLSAAASPEAAPESAASYAHRDAHRIFSPQVGQLKIALKSAMDVLDKVSWFVNLYLNLEVKTNKVSMHTVLTRQRRDVKGDKPWTKARRRHADRLTETMTMNPWLSAIVALAEGLSAERQPGEMLFQSKEKSEGMPRLTDHYRCMMVGRRTIPCSHHSSLNMRHIWHYDWPGRRFCT